MASDILNSLIFPTVFALTLVAVFTNRAAELFRLFGYLALMRIMVVFMVLPMMGMGYYLIYILPNHVESSFMGDIFGADKLDFIIHDPTFLFICGAQIVTLIVGGVLAHTLDRLYPPEK